MPKHVWRGQKTSDQTLLGGEGKFGEELGLSNDWALNAITAVDYGEIMRLTLDQIHH